MDFFFPLSSPPQMLRKLIFFSTWSAPSQDSINIASENSMSMQRAVEGVFNEKEWHKTTMQPLKRLRFQVLNMFYSNKVLQSFVNYKSSWIDKRDLFCQWAVASPCSGQIPAMQMHAAADHSCAFQLLRHDSLLVACPEALVGLGLQAP